MSGIIYKMIESRLMAQNGKLNKLNKEIEKKINELSEVCKELDHKLEKVQGMSKFTYAWCKSAQEANVFKLKQKY